MTNPEKIKQILLSEIERMDQHREDFCSVLESILPATGKSLSIRSSISRSPWRADPSTMNCSNIFASMPQRRRFLHSTSSAPSFPMQSSSLYGKEMSLPHYTS